MAVAMLGSVLGGGLGFVFVLVMARLMHQAQFGLLVLAVNLVNQGAALGVWGADYATIRFVSAARTPGRKRGAMLTPLLLVTALNLGLALVVLVLARPIAVHLLGQPRFTNPLRVVALVLPLTVIAQMLSAANSGLEQARGELVRKVVEQGGRIVLAPLALAAGLGLVGAVFGMLAAAAGAVLAVGVILVRSLPRGGKIERVGAREVFSFAWPQSVANVASQLWSLVAIGVLAQFGSTRALALWGAAVAIARIPALIYNSFAFRFSPTISRLWEERRLDELHELLKSVTRWVAILAVPLYAIAVALPGPLLQIYGSKFQGGSVALVLIAFAVLIDSLAGPVDRALIMTGRVKLEMAANLVTAAVMLVASVLLTYYYGLNGAAIGLILYNVLVNATKALLVWKLMRMNPLSLPLVGPIAAAALSGGVVAAIDRTTSLGHSLVGTALLAAVLLVLYAVLLLRVIGVSSADRNALRIATRSAR
jgi:O-antigen/teichoic acid export membrane protein